MYVLYEVNDYVDICFTDAGTVQVPTTEPKYLSEELLEMLEILDIYMYNDQRLWSQLCHLMRHSIKYNLHQMEHNPSAEVKQRLEQVQQTSKNITLAAEENAFDLIFLHPFNGSIHICYTSMAAPSQLPVLWLRGGCGVCRVLVVIKAWPPNIERSNHAGAVSGKWAAAKFSWTVCRPKNSFWDLSWQSLPCSLPVQQSWQKSGQL